MPEFSDYEFADVPEIPDVITKFEEFLNGFDNLTTRDVDNIEIVIYCRLRALLTADQLHQRAHILIAQAEHALHMPGAFTDPDTGEEVQPILVENFPGGHEEVLAMFEQGKVDDESIAAFLSQFVESEEE